MDLTALSQTPIAALAVIVTGFVIYSSFRLITTIITKGMALVSAMGEVTKSSVTLTEAVKNVQDSSTLLLNTIDGLSKSVHSLEVKVDTMTVTLASILSIQQTMYGLIMGSIGYRRRKKPDEKVEETTDDKPA